MRGAIRFKWVACIALLLAEKALASPATSGSTSEKVEVRIIGGSYGDIKYFPFIVSIQIYYAAWTHHCGGSILTANVVLTACHCVVVTPRPRVYRQPSTFRIVAGSSNLYNYGADVQVVRAARLEAHPSCTAGSWRDDTGLVILKKRLRFTLSVQPLALYSTDINEAARRIRQLESQSKICYSPGWGIYDQVNISPQLKFTAVYLLTSDKCDAVNCRYSSACGINYWQLHQVCAIQAGAIFCSGDSGGPLVCDGQVYGVVSYNFGCRVGTPMTFADIQSVLPTVRNYLQTTSSKSKASRSRVKLSNHGKRSIHPNRTIHPNIG